MHSAICGSLFGVVVLHRSMVNWMGDTSAFRTCAFYYMCNLFGVGDFPEIYAQLEEGVGSVCHGYMCILLYVKLILCSCVA